MSVDEFAEVCRKKNMKFDYITFFEVLEHQDQPVKFIETVKSLLKEGGRVAGSVPNRERLFAGIRRKFVDSDDFPPNHFLWFNRSSLEKFLSDMGFRNVFVVDLREPFGPASYYILESLYFPFILKNIIKRRILGVKESVPLQASANTERDKGRKLIIQFLKAVKTGISLPFLPFSFFVKRHLYFEATL